MRCSVVMYRHKKVQALLQATPADMQRICKAHPSTLCRDPLQLLALIKNLQVHLQKPQVSRPQAYHAVYSQVPYQSAPFVRTPESLTPWCKSINAPAAHIADRSTSWSCLVRGRCTGASNCCCVLLLLLQDEVAALIRQQPGLLSWNLSELINRIIVVSQALRLEPPLRGALVSAHNTALLTHHTDIPQRVEYLIKYLDLPGGCSSAHN